jgi:ubiquinone/menaquinone biosynthesis C-methylase UbiE
MSMGRQAAFGVIAVLAGLLASASPVMAQLASRPAAEWVAVLEAPERLAGLKIHEVASSLEIDEGDVIADLGAGSGPFVLPFAGRVSPKGKVYAVDIDKGFFEYIEKRAKAADAPNVMTVLGDPTDPKLPAADVDIAFFHDVVHHIADRPAYLKNLVKYLKPDARVAVIDYNPAQSPHQGEPALQVSKAQVTAWMAEAGFKPLYEISLFSDKYFVIYRR